ncbi:oxidoreductase like domain containing 1 [Homo sapiens]|uniref:HCG1644378, isoform CRA_a n=1 Tax=Homo sapiens TaxID=9606 RepID=I3L208_HUMAN|nr:oxidoreductase-like domain-containing protein 1 isoform c [Homo sapiens]NP_001291928.1 oxidoreductase-like domain-containing protein 1 isoform c [Homo sapiens]EAW89667.1 hCG1644378, isoform CRA_a [Homo sapiens]KAI2585633.1 oxidoreductase like domain containing 1 [Homo sapiens]KAI2585634.1 oxidoreductase like domain containing 1 [Homo sapiens]KAI2585635.1 oxidoreductase like domain containing 1 [Homo sapiens]KAI4052151.1 oxidoreductase like domain containing 1 [Homo sapiens]|eukprot:NP_001291924.1 oxidoreductase-like domain-containing protein 1 isoform c [Homo sapiens]
MLLRRVVEGGRAVAAAVRGSASTRTGLGSAEGHVREAAVRGPARTGRSPGPSTRMWGRSREDRALAAAEGPLAPLLHRLLPSPRPGICGGAA